MKRIAAIVALCCVSAFGKGVDTLPMAVGCETRFYTAKDYVNADLAFMLDSKENAGWGEHNYSVGWWVDLVSGAATTFTIGANSFWQDGAFVRKAALGNFYLPISVIVANSTTTIVFRNDDATGASNPRIVGSNDGGRRFEIDVYDTEVNKSPRIYFKRLNSSMGSWFGNLPPIGQKITSLTFVVSSDGILKVWADDWSMQIPTALDLEFYTAATKLNLGAWYNTSSAMNMSAFNIRRYNRALTDAEVLHFHNIDKERFGL